MAIHSSIFAWKNPMDRGTCQAFQSMGLQSRTQLSTHALPREQAGDYVLQGSRAFTKALY